MFRFASNKLMKSRNVVQTYSRFRGFSNLMSLPFQISKEDAQKIIVNNRKILEKSARTESNSLVVYDPDNDIKDCFIPFHSTDLDNIISSFDGEYGIDRTEYYTSYEYNESSKSYEFVTKSRIVTDWYGASGTLSPTNYPFGTQNTQIYAGFTYPRKEIEKVLTKKDVVKIVKLTDDVLKGTNGKNRYVHPHDMTISFAIEKIISIVHGHETERAKNYLLKAYNADHAKISNLNIRLESAGIKLFSYHLPAYVHRYKYNNMYMYKFVDGYSGNYAGEYVMSPVKTFAITSLIGAVIPLVIGPFFSVGAIATKIIITRMLIGGLATGIPSAIYANFRHVYKKNSANSINDADTDKNKSFQESDDDIERKNRAEQINDGANWFSGEDRYNFSGVNNDITEKLVLLELDPNKLPSEDELKKQYYISIKKWHPDVYKGDKNIAHKMTSQINVAYNALHLYISK